MTENTKIHHRSCTLCEAVCGIEIQTKGKEIISIRGDKNDPLSQGYICPKAVALQDIYNDPDRLRHPVKRTDDGWQRISWEQALDEIAKNFKKIQKEYGKDAVGLYSGNPRVHNYGSILYAPFLIKALQTKNCFSAASIDQLPQYFAAYFMFGHQLLLSIPDIDNTDFFVIFGGNPVVSGGSIMTAPGMPRRLKALRKRGGKLIVIDPRKTETAALADTHYFIRPGTDVFLLLGLLHVVFAENLVNPARLRSCIEETEINMLGSLVSEYAPEKVEKITGIKASDIFQLACDFASANHAACYGRMGTCAQKFGAVTHWLMLTFNIVTGKLDHTGGPMFTKPAVDTLALAKKLGKQGSFGRWHSRVRKFPEFGGEFPIATMAEEILNPGEGQIKGLLTIAGNPVLSAPNGKNLEKGLPGLDFMASVDFYINETTKYANIILPPTDALERDNYEIPFHLLSVRNTAKYYSSVFEPKDDTKHEWEIILELKTRLEAKSPKSAVVARMKQKMMGKLLSPKKMLNILLCLGPYGKKGKAGLGLNIKKLEKAVHGIDIGPLQPCFPERLYTESKKINLTPEVLVKDLKRVKKHFDAYLNTDDYDLLLIGRRHLRSNNSWMHNSLRLVKGKKRCVALMHPKDANKRHISSGETIEVRSQTGSIEIEVELSEDIMSGVISIPHGWGHCRSGVKWQVAQQHAGVSVNDITDAYYIDELSGNAAVNGVSVKVSSVQKMDPTTNSLED